MKENRKREMVLFLEKVEESLKGNQRSEIDIDLIKDIPLTNLECIYLFDFSKNKIVYHRGFDTVFGYKNEQIGMDYIFDMYHPEDAPIIQSIIKWSVFQMVDIHIPEFTNIMNMAYRLKRADGSFARILSNTIIFKNDREGKIQSILVKYIDISFTHDSEAVEWMVDTKYLDLDKIKQSVYGKDHLIFTSRELEVVQEILKGFTNKEIAFNLHISEHTVATHRKNILTKSNAHDVKGLLDYCKKNGVVRKENQSED